jgi:hypothetical protein
MDVNVQTSILSLTHFARMIQKNLPTIDKCSDNETILSKGIRPERSDADRAAKTLNALATLLSRGIGSEKNRMVSVLASSNVQTNLDIVVAK